jgi:thioesterase domain-containing protein
LRELRLTLVESYEMDDIPWLVLECYSDRSTDDAMPSMVDWYRWRAENLPMEVGRHFMLCWVGPEIAGAG